jgi:hypothetical protein
MSVKTAHKPIAWTAGRSANSAEPVAHESRARFRPAVKPGRRAVAAGVDGLDLSEKHEHARRSGSRRLERLFAEHVNE